MATSDEISASDGRYMKCALRIDTKAGWENSLTKVLSSFQDPTFDIDPLMGLAHVKGKINPHTGLKKLKKGAKHAMIQWVTYGPEEDDQYYQASQPYVPLPTIGYAYDPYYYHYPNDPYNYPLYGNYNSWHQIDPILLNNAHNHNLCRRCPGGRPRSSVHLHQHNLPVQSSSTSSPSRPVTEPNLTNQPASSIGLGFIKKVFSIKKVAGKFGSCLRCDEKK